MASLIGRPSNTTLRISPKNVLQKGLKIVFFAQKTPDFGPKNRLRIWGVPPSPLYGFFFSEKGVTDLGGTPPLTDKIRTVVFDPLPYQLPKIAARGSQVHRVCVSAKRFVENYRTDHG